MSPTDDQCTNTAQPVAKVLREKHPDMLVAPVENPTCAAFEEYEDVSETAPFDFTEDDFTWFASNLSSAAGALEVEAIELNNCLLRLECASEDLRFVIVRLADWMANTPPLRRLFHTNSMALDKRPGVRPVGIGDTLSRALAKLVMREARYQPKTACDNL